MASGWDEVAAAKNEVFADQDNYDNEEEQSVPQSNTFDFNAQPTFTFNVEEESKFGNNSNGPTT